ncbi:hypothetical protein R4P64_33405 [Rhodococcus sp. IEGM 1366]|nr:hypothetical protein [Rhodococcus sp. IEGM 1366]MDV8071411.1 hypothetical protein [Rhodococcus sp. IEGM 1366]
MSPLDGGIPEIGVDTGFEFATDNGFDIGGGYERIESQREEGVAP